MNLFDFSMRLKRFPIKNANIFLNGIKSSKQNLKEYQNHSAWSIFEYHYKNNSFYQKLTGHKYPDKWDQVPIVDKSTFSKNYPSYLVSKNINYKTKTSGSTGTPFKLARDKFSHALIWEHAKQKYFELGIEYGNSFEARFYGLSKRTFSKIKEQIKDKLASRERFVVQDLSNSKLREFLMRFEKNSYDFIYGYTNSILRFAKYLSQEGVILKEINPAIKLVIVTAETCSKQEKSFIEEVIGVPVYIEYGSSEFGIIAIQNKENQFIVSDELLIIEVLDENNKVVPNGIYGKFVITSFFNKATPLIRYEIGDYGKIEFNENLGRHLITDLKGRLNDFALLPSGKVVPGFSLYYFIKDVLDSKINILEYNITQLTLDDFELQIVCNGEIPMSTEVKLEVMLKDYLDENVKVKIRKVSEINRTSTGKFKHFISKVG